jgi:hypothetical protein
VHDRPSATLERCPPLARNSNQVYVASGATRQPCNWASTHTTQ